LVSVQNDRGAGWGSGFRHRTADGDGLDGGLALGLITSTLLQIVFFLAHVDGLGGGGKANEGRDRFAGTHEFLCLEQKTQPNSVDVSTLASGV